MEVWSHEEKDVDSSISFPYQVDSDNHCADTGPSSEKTSCADVLWKLNCPIGFNNSLCSLD